MVLDAMLLSLQGGSLTTPPIPSPRSGSPQPKQNDVIFVLLFFLVTYHMVGNFREGVYFRACFMSQEPFVKTKTTKFLLSMWKVNKLCFNPSYVELSGHQWRLVSSCAFDGYR